MKDVSVPYQSQMMIDARSWVGMIPFRACSEPASNLPHVSLQGLAGRLRELDGLKNEQQQALKDAALEHQALRKELDHDKKKVDHFDTKDLPPVVTACRTRRDDAMW